jgi:hypothetical protein
MSILSAFTVILLAVPTTSITPDVYVKPAPATVDFSCSASAAISIPPLAATTTSIWFPVLERASPAISCPAPEN